MFHGQNKKNCVGNLKYVIQCYSTSSIDNKNHKKKKTDENDATKK